MSHELSQEHEQMVRAVRGIFAAVLLVACAAVEAGCASGYVTYFQPELKSAREVPHRDPYMRPPPPAGAEVAAGSISVGCTNIRKFILLPIPWFRRGFRPSELQVELAFSGSPDSVLVDLGSVTATLDGVVIQPKHVEYEGRRLAPQYVETVPLPKLRRVRLDSPTFLTFTFSVDAGDASKFRMTLGEITVDGTRTLIPPLGFSREGDFVTYRFPEKKRAPGPIVSDPALLDAF